MKRGKGAIQLGQGGFGHCPDIERLTGTQINLSKCWRSRPRNPQWSESFGVGDLFSLSSPRVIPSLLLQFDYRLPTYPHKDLVYQYFSIWRGHIPPQTKRVEPVNHSGRWLSLYTRLYCHLSVMHPIYCSSWLWGHCTLALSLQMSRISVLVFSSTKFCWCQCHINQI